MALGACGLLVAQHRLGTAGWGEQPLRYWLDSREVNRRIALLNVLYERVGIARGR